MKNKALIFNLVFSAVLAGIISLFCICGAAENDTSIIFESENYLY